MRGLAIGEALTAVASLAGAIGLVTGSIDLGAVINRRLPFGSPAFGGLALIVVVVLPMATGVVLSWRGSGQANLVAIADGALLMGWIVDELAVIRSFSILQPIFAVVGAAIAFGGYRRWHLTWGATEDEVVGVMPGDDIFVPAIFSATRAITIDAPPMAVWPWLVQVGVGRAGFYSHDSVDNKGRDSVREVLCEFQDPRIGDIAAPMIVRPSARTSFVVASADCGRSLVWAKEDAACGCLDRGGSSRDG
jgi:hypothetical protein